MTGRYALVVACLAAGCAGPGLLAQEPLKLTLAEARRLAVQNNPQFTEAKLMAAAAYQVPSEYRAAYTPNVFSSLTGAGADTGSRLAAGGLNNPVVYNRLGAGITLSQMITDFGRTGNLVAMAGLRAKAQDQLTESTREQLLLASDRAYFGVLRAEAVLTVAQQTVKSRELVVEQVSALAESKLKSTLDVSFSKVNLADARLLLAQALNDIRAAEAQLATILGMPGQVAFTLADEPMPGALPSRVEELIQTALADRPELKDLRLEQSAAERFVKAEHALYYPSVGLVGTTGFVPAGQDQVPGHYGAVGVNVTIPIFNGGLYKARTEEARLRARAGSARIGDLENRIARDVRVAYLNAVTAYDRVGLTDQLLQQAQLALELAQSRYDLGLGSIVELSQAQLNLTSAQIASSTARYDYQAQRSVVDFQTASLK